MSPELRERPSVPHDLPEAVLKKIILLSGKEVTTFTCIMFSVATEMIHRHNVEPSSVIMARIWDRRGKNPLKYLGS